MSPIVVCDIAVVLLHAQQPTTEHCVVYVKPVSNLNYKIIKLCSIYIPGLHWWKTKTWQGQVLTLDPAVALLWLYLGAIFYVSNQFAIIDIWQFEIWSRCTTLCVRWDQIIYFVTLSNLWLLQMLLTLSWTNLTALKMLLYCITLEIKRMISF